MSQEDHAMIEALRRTAVGPAFVRYLKRLIDELCDIRTMAGVSETERLGRVEASKILERYVIDLIGSPDVSKPPQVKGENGEVLNPFE